MARYVALLRGLNVGGHRVKMDRLRGLFEDLGFDEVTTVLASGNVIFSARSEDTLVLRAAIANRLEAELGYEVASFLRTHAEMAAISTVEPAGQPAGEVSPISHYVIFLHEPASKALRLELEALSSETDAFHFECREVHWWIRGRLSESPLFGGAFDRATRGIPNTMRNMNTVRKLVVKTAARGQGWTPIAHLKKRTEAS
jgi:uncharacterized protein (DUF1697 family)